MDPSKSSDVRAAEQTVVDYANGRLFVKSPRNWAPFGAGQMVVLTLLVPTGSALDGTSAMGHFHVEGDLRHDETDRVDGQPAARPDR